MTAATAIARLNEHAISEEGRPEFAPPTFCLYPPKFNASAPEVQRHLTARATHHSVTLTNTTGLGMRRQDGYHASSRRSEIRPPGASAAPPPQELEGEDLEWMPAVVLETRPLCERALLLEPWVRERAYVREMGVQDQVNFVMQIGQVADLGPEVIADTVVIEMVPPGTPEDLRRGARSVHGKPQFGHQYVDPETVPGR